MSSRGRPVATSHAQIEAAAFRLFAQRGFEAVTMADIAAEVGVGRRTLFRYFDSKNDIPWGQFASTLEQFRHLLASMPDDLPLWEAVHRGVLAFNDVPEGADPPHRDRMRLILSTPALQAHSVHQYAEWRGVIAEYVAARTGLRATDTLPRTVGSVSLALAISAYEGWLDDPGTDLATLLAETLASVRRYLVE